MRRQFRKVQGKGEGSFPGEIEEEDSEGFDKGASKKKVVGVSRAGHGEVMVYSSRSFFRSLGRSLFGSDVMCFTPHAYLFVNFVFFLQIDEVRIGIEVVSFLLDLEEETVTPIMVDELQNYKEPSPTHGIKGSWASLSRRGQCLRRLARRSCRKARRPFINDVPEGIYAEVENEEDVTRSVSRRRGGGTT